MSYRLSEAFSIFAFRVSELPRAHHAEMLFSILFFVFDIKAKKTFWLQLFVLKNYLQGRYRTYVTVSNCFYLLIASFPSCLKYSNGIFTSHEFTANACCHSSIKTFDCFTVWMLYFDSRLIRLHNAEYS